MITDSMSVVYSRPQSLTPVVTHYCPGCTHGVIQRLVAEVLDELEVREKTIGVASVGCSVFVYNYFDCDFCGAPHGRAPAMATPRPLRHWFAVTKARSSGWRSTLRKTGRTPKTSCRKRS